MTAGDAGYGQDYWQSREAGALASYAQMAGVPNSWIQADAGIPGHPMTLDTLAGAPEISLIFMHLPDGNGDGSGFVTTGNVSMQQLWNGDILSLSTVDGSPSYSRQGVINALLSLMQGFQPTEIRVQDYVGTFGDGDHSDHHASAYFSQAAHLLYNTPHTFVGYLDYNSANMPQNVTGTDLTQKKAAFYTYTPYDFNVCGTEAQCTGTMYASWLQRQYTVGSQTGGTGTVQSPTANAGPNQSVASKVQVQLDGSASTSPTASPLTYQWTQIAGPTVTLSSAIAAKPTFTSPFGPATLLFQLVVNNGQAASAPANVVVSVAAPVGTGPACPCSVFSSSATPATASAPDTGSYELGMKFQAADSGYVTGVRFYKGSQNTGTHTGSLWDLSGHLLATATFTNETASGWQQVAFSNPVAISQNTTYVVSYHTDVGHFALDRPYFTGTTANIYGAVPVHPLPDGGSAGPNGVFLAGGSGFPTSSYDASNYWVDLTFTTNYDPSKDPPYVQSVAPSSGASNVTTSSPVAVTFSKAMDPTTLTANTFTLQDPQGHAVAATLSYSSASNTATLTPSVALAGGTVYTATVKGGSGGVADLSATTIPSSYTWTFTTSGPPTASAVSPSSGATGVAAQPAVTAGFSQPMDPTTITTSTIQLLNSSNAVVPATVTYGGSNYTATLTPSSSLTLGATYTAVVRGGSSGVKTPSGSTLAADYSWTFTVRQCPCSIWNSSVTPTTTSSTDSNAYELGMRFTSDASGYITGVRFYKGSQNTGAHYAHLWDNAGNKLAEGLFLNESASGWQTMTFNTPVRVNANTTYVVSYHTDVGHYAVDRPYFTSANSSAYNNAPLHALTDGQGGSNGVYFVGGIGFPNSSYNSSNYWVDPVFATSVTTSSTPPTVASVSPANGATGVSPAPTVSASFSVPMDPTTITTSTVQLLSPSNTPVAATVSYASLTQTATLTLTGALTANATYTGVVHGGSGGVKDTTGNPMASDYRWTFTTQACPCSVWSTSVTPTTTSVPDTGAYELGMKFQVAVPGYVTGVRFYKGSLNTGTHLGNLWDSTGHLLATVTFTNETASGWQTATFSSPVLISANTTYVVSYHTDVGHFAVDRPYFTSANSGAFTGQMVNAAIDGGSSGSNGVYFAGASAYPNASYNASNYWVDAIFSPQ